MRHVHPGLLALLGGFTIGLASMACVQTNPFGAPRLGGPANPRAAAESAPTSAPNISATMEAASSDLLTAPPASSSRPSATVRVGPISELMTLSGRVSSPEEAALRVQVAGRVEKVHVEPGQPVDVGRVLVELDIRDQAKELSAARSRLQVASLRLGQATQQAEQRVRDAEAEVRRAQLDASVSRTGAKSSELQAAEASVSAARTALERAQADMTKAAAGPTAQELTEAQQQVATAQLALQRAQAEQARLRRGADPLELSAAEREVAAAQATLSRSQSELNRLQRGPDPLELGTAEREVDRARSALRVAQSARGDTRAARDAAATSAQISLADAEARLARVRQGPRPEDVATARRESEVARAALDAAQQRLAQVRRGPDQITVSTADLAVDQGRLALQVAEGRLRALQTGPTNDQVSLAAAAVESARAAYASAQAQLAELRTRGTGVEVIRADDRLSTAATALERARSSTGQSGDPTNPAAIDVILLDKEVRELRAEVETLERQVNDSTIKAPALGWVSSVKVRPGDPVDAGQVVLTVAKPTNPIVLSEIDDEQFERLSVQMGASVRITGREPQPGTLSTLSVGGTGGRVAQFSVPWAGQPPAIGTSADIAVTVTTRDDALIVPKKAVRSAGSRRYVEYLDATGRRSSDVQVGITSGDEVEIIQGLSPGQVVLLAP